MIPKEAPVRFRVPAAALLAFGGLFAFAGCDFDGPSAEGVGIRGVSQSAPYLPEFDATGQYTPYYATGDMARPRYWHKGIAASNGLSIVMGGSDERGYSGLDTVEIFDQAQVDPNKVKPKSLTGLWIDTDLEGNPIAFQNGARMLFTITRMGGKYLCVGGTGDLFQGPLVEPVEVFDPDTRKFETLEPKLINSRIRHVAINLNDGGILFIGGQTLSTVTVINQNVPEGQPGRQQQVTVFVTTQFSELYSPTENEFVRFTLPESSTPSRLSTPRGRAGHAIERIAGPDNRLRSADDIFLIAGGFQTLGGQSAPRSKLPGAAGRNEADALRVLEFFDPLTRVFTQVGSLQLATGRVTDPYIMNLGWYNNLTIDGVRGLANVVLVTHGNIDDSCPETPFTDELLTAIYTGFGPAQGLQFFRVEETQFASHTQGGEPDLAGDQYAAGRCATNPVYLPRKMEQATGVGGLQTWILTTAGCLIVNTPFGCVYAYNDYASIGSGCVFDPFYSLPAYQLGLSTRDLASGRNRNNPAGVIGCWLNLDGQIPTVDLTYYGTTPVARWARQVAPARVFNVNLPLPGEDGILDTPDDRILLAGGGQDYVSLGGEPTIPSAEVLVPPKASEKNYIWP